MYAGTWHQRVFWGASEGMLAAMLIVVAGDAGLTALQEVITVVGLPMFVLVFLMMFALFRGLSKESLSEVTVVKPPRVEEL